MGICMCGTLAGYPHDVTCPYPLYRGSEALAEKWEADRVACRAERESMNWDGAFMADEAAGLADW